MPHSVLKNILYLFYPHYCETCASAALGYEQIICARCLHQLPRTNFEKMPGNPVEKLFYGRLKLAAAFSLFYYSKGKKLQTLMHALKYRGNTDVGTLLGALLADAMVASARFNTIDMIVPLPLNKKKEFKRGFNQAAVIATAMGNELSVPVVLNNLRRDVLTETQTHKHRMERWKNVEGSFSVKDPAVFEGKHILLVDDVLTTGATLESAGLELINIAGARLSIATAAFAGK